ncbi:PucR family transcriptional regulator ligand-binding domain-containing protein [Bifidobacterium sp. 64T4]|uniref:PucR family transcriptional regulator n=1 Tax=Bifidobacterium pongonis TaxID=2834432 RepID=UPI001C58ED8F|nr:PucR family transcriptional regulator [Bifidobacterium pongonis]MBW3094538.1 PucR family transcriptional regulator ligand-binding domain-containing protein [Bifidobacterium pongonis]
MALELRELLDGCPEARLDLLAGADGLTHRVTWVHVLESTMLSDYLGGDELILTTGVALRGDDDLLSYVRALYARGAAGVALDTGHYIERIPVEVTTFCEEHAFPLFAIPKDVAFESIARPLCRRLIDEETKDRMIGNAFRNAISYPDRQELYIPALSEFHFEIEWRYAVIIIRLDDFADDPYKRIDAMNETVRKYLRRRVRFSATYGEWERIVAVVHCAGPEELRDVGRGVLETAQRALRGKETVSIGVGKLTQSIRCICKSHRQAESILKLQARGKLDDRLNFFDDLGAYRVLLGVEDPEISQEYYRQVLGPLLEYDKENGADLTDVLRSYLDHNGSVRDTAADLFVHRNTVNYKIAKAGEILCMDLSQLKNRMQLMLGYMLMDMM